jgi:hypothetical protein
LDAELETLAGVIIGDWFTNGLLGVLIAMLLVRLFYLHSFIPWITPPSSGMHHATEDDDLEHLSSHQWRYFAYWILFLIVNPFLVTWVYPNDHCLERIPRDCINTGLMVYTVVIGVLLAILHWIHRADPLIWPYRTPFAIQRWILFFIWFVIVTIHVQNFQTIVPLYLGG